MTEVKRRCDLILCMTTGGFSPSTEERASVVTAFQPELASLNAGSMNFGLFQVVSKYPAWQFPWEPAHLAGTEDLVFANTFARLREFCDIFRRSDTKPELEVYDLGMVNNVGYLVDTGQLDLPARLQFVLGILGGAPATFENLSFLVREAEQRLGDVRWSVCAAGRHQLPMCTAGLLLGGNVRVGLEDNLYLSKGVMAESNAQLVAKIVRIAQELGREPASPGEARAMLGLKGLVSVGY
jgi:uncharacterized protein (DUF849 family)